MTSSTRIRQGAVLAVLAAISAICMAQSAGKAPAQTPKDEFLARITQYLELRKRVIGTPIKPTASSKKINSQRQQAAQKMLDVRKQAKQGELFTPSVAKYFQGQLTSALFGPDGKRIRATLKHSEPVKNISVGVNQRYPAAVPLQSTPPTLLLNLPQLPQELEYRIVGRALVLRDTGTNLIVDYIADALPIV